MAVNTKGCFVDRITFDSFFAVQIDGTVVTFEAVRMPILVQSSQPLSTRFALFRSNR